jgi:glycogen synthase
MAPAPRQTGRVPFRLARLSKGRPVKILVLTNLFPPLYLGGYELICHTVVKALRARGHDVEVLTSDYGVPEGRANGKDPQVERSLQIHGMFGRPWLPIHRLQQLERHNNRTLRRALARVRPDLVYVWNCSGISKSMLFTVHALGLPSVYYMSDHWLARSNESDVWLRWWNHPSPNSMQRLLRGLAAVSGVRRFWGRVAPTDPIHRLKIERIYFCSRALRDLTVAAGIDVQHGAIIYCPVDTIRFNKPPRPASQPMERLLWVGRLTPDKGVMTALKAMALARAQFPGTLHIYGSGDADYVSDLKTLAREQALPVTFEDGVPAEAMPEVYARHDALLFTSEWAEPFALTPLEAMASGLPVIGTTTGGSGELFRDGENARTYEAGNASELAARMVELYRNPEGRASLATAGHREVRKRFAEPVIVDQIEVYLQETLERNARGGEPHV